MTAYGSPNFIRTPSYRDADELAVKTMFGADGRRPVTTWKTPTIFSVSAAALWTAGDRLFACSGPAASGKKKRSPWCRLSRACPTARPKPPAGFRSTPEPKPDLALGIAAVMIDQNLAADAAVSGLDSWKADLLTNYPTTKVSQTTGVPHRCDRRVGQGICKGQPTAGALRPRQRPGGGKPAGKPPRFMPSMHWPATSTRTAACGPFPRQATSGGLRCGHR